MSKRKRELDVHVPRTASPSTVATSDGISPTRKKKAKAKATEGDDDGHSTAEIIWELADGSRSWKKRIKRKNETTLDDFLPRVLEHLDIVLPDATTARLAHVREGGREVEIYDDFDFQAFKARALASTSSTPLVVKVYPSTESSGNAVASSSKTPGPVSSAVDKVSKRKKVSKETNPRNGEVNVEPMQCEHPKDRSSTAKASAKKSPIITAPSPVFPQAPPANLPVSSSTSLPKAKAKKKVKLAIPDGNQPYTPTPASSSTGPLRAKPSVLVPNPPISAVNTSGELSTPTAPPKSASKKQVRILDRTIPQPVNRAAPLPSTDTPASTVGRPLVAPTTSPSSNSTKTKPRSRRKGEISSPSSSEALSAAQTADEQSRSDELPTGLSPTAGPGPAMMTIPVADFESLVEKSVLRALKRHRPSHPSPLSNMQIPPPNAADGNMEELEEDNIAQMPDSVELNPLPSIPPTSTLARPHASVQQNDNMIPPMLPNTPSPRKSSPLILSAPYNLYGKPAEPNADRSYSSSSFDTPAPAIREGKVRRKTPSDASVIKAFVQDGAENALEISMAERVDRNSTTPGIPASTSAEGLAEANKPALSVDPPTSLAMPIKPTKRSRTAERKIASASELAVPMLNDSTAAGMTNTPQQLSSDLPVAADDASNESDTIAKEQPKKSSAAGVKRKSIPSETESATKQIMRQYREKLAAEQAAKGGEKVQDVVPAKGLRQGEAASPERFPLPAVASKSMEQPRQSDMDSEAASSDGDLADGTRDPSVSLSDVPVAETAGAATILEPVKAKREAKKAPEVMPAVPDRLPSTGEASLVPVVPLVLASPASRDEEERIQRTALSKPNARPEQPSKPGRIRQQSAQSAMSSNSQQETSLVPSDSSLIPPATDTVESATAKPKSRIPKKAITSTLHQQPPDPAFTPTTSDGGLNGVPHTMPPTEKPVAVRPSRVQSSLPPRSDIHTDTDQAPSDASSASNLQSASRVRQAAPKVPNIKGSSVSAQHARLDLRAACLICGAPWHLQKVCPRVKEGVGSLKRVLREKEEEETGPTTEAAIEAIKNWIDMLTRVRGKVLGVESDGQLTSSPSTPARKSVAVAKKTVKDATPARDTQPISGTAVSDPVEVQFSAASRSPPSTPPPRRSKSPTKAAAANDTGDQHVQDRITPAHPLYLKALSRSRKTGSLSGLSASDAVIETGGSEDEASSSDDTDDDDASRESDSNSSDSSHKSAASKQARSSISQTSDSEDHDSETSETESMSSAQSSSASSHSSSRNILTQPLSERQKKAARESAASMQPLDLTMLVDEDVSDIEQSDSDEQRPERGGSDSSIGDFGEGEQEDETRTSEGSEIKSVGSQPPVLVAKSATSSPHSSRSSRSFVALDQQAGDSPVVDTFEGAMALREAIDEEDRPEREAMADILVEESARPKAEAPRSHIISQGLPSPPSSHDNELVEETAPAHDEPISTPVSLERREKQSKGSLAPPLELDRLASGRRLRSASREVTSEVSPRVSIRRDTRATSSRSQSVAESPRAVRASRQSVEHSPSTLRAARHSPIASPRTQRAVDERSTAITRTPKASARMPDVEKSLTGLQVDLNEGQGAESPVGPSPRRQRVYGSVRSSQVDELDSSQLCQPSPGTPKPSRAQTPVRPRQTPLFTTQPSQAPATQAYNPYPSSDPPEQQVSSTTAQPSRPNALANGDLRHTSPIPAEDDENNEEDDASRSPSPDLPNGHSAQSSDSASDDETSIIPAVAPKIYPALPRHHSASQPQNSFPSLSSLPKDILRIGRSAMPAFMGTSSQPAKKAVVKESEESDTSSSDEEDVPAGLKGRFAGGNEKKKVKTGGAMRGW